MSAKNEFLCILPDKPDALARRLEVRAQHLANVTPLVESGKVVLGGAMLDQHPKPDDSVSFKGSVMIYVAESKEEVERLVKNDIYTKSDVWDLEKAQIIPFKSAARLAL
ncbi:hypothetical protein ASPACDRAFT_41341 [Aspergillus aculeatus ATCC 16872]|uniref:YCII-related domain-containing protein n=1 Tax=Aspergillus aculeatus (strain ATCC 16872 / CBS 172.66 / WB 5094) TaxID=690307 RepID=A0A1L9X1Y9_ASPA1|nr:uncharacterized protein ASPACDRAFT_41341 [Aspergillus aculeatus ATCC 16872]OJK02512.1 hypothetical protein ASPACDRAFT_41341 [Aspergillus aculeatus ATCC 16872]